MAERCLWDDEAVMEVLAPPGGVYKWMHSTMSSKPFSENMKWIPQLCEKAEVSVFCLSIELVCTQTESSSEHRTHWQWCISVAGQPKIYRLCRSVWAVHQIRSQRVSFVSACFCCPPSYHPLPKKTQCSHLHKYNGAVFFPLTESDWVELWSHISPPALFVHTDSWFLCSLGFI